MTQVITFKLSKGHRLTVIMPDGSKKSFDMNKYQIEGDAYEKYKLVMQPLKVSMLDCLIEQLGFGFKDAYELASTLYGWRSAAYRITA